jgi:hypothetical protein
MPANVAGPAPQAVDDASKIGAEEKPAAKAEPRQDTAEISKGIAAHLDIPDDVLKQIAPKVVEEPKAQAETSPKAPETPEQSEEEKPEKEVAPPPKQSPDTEEETDEEEEGEDEAEHEEEKPAAEQKPDKRQKRINRLTRKNSELEMQLDTVFNENKTLKEQLEGKAAPAVPSSTGLSHIATERQLNQEVAQAEAIIDWCDQNAEGVRVQEDGGEKFIDSQEVAKWKRKAEKVTRLAPLRLKELESHTQTQTYFDGLAKQAWPELFDKRSKEYQLAQSILSEFPSVKTSPQANWAVGLVVEGMKSLQGRTQKGQQPAATQPKHRDIDERAFAPRVPLAPHTAEPPSREATPSAHKRLKEATSALLADPDGSVGSLAKVFGVLNEARASGGRQRVSV